MTETESRSAESRSRGAGNRTVYLSAEQADEIEHLGVTLAEVIRRGIALLREARQDAGRPVSRHVLIELRPDGTYAVNRRDGGTT